jgi:RsiW-degrading membrane proteinase PrsW (M82 family)
MVNFFVSWFIFKGIHLNQVLASIGIGILFGAIWYAVFWTTILKKPYAWSILVVSTFLTWIALSFIQIPLQAWISQAFTHFFKTEVLMKWILLTTLPQILMSGFVQEGSKLLPVAVYWWKKDKKIDPKVGLLAGAVAGLGFGVFEAIWVLNTNFTAGWNIEMIKTQGLFIALIPFIERFFAVAFHTSASAIAGWGLAKGWGWQFYIIVSIAHATVNYNVIIIAAGLLNKIQIEIYIAAVVLIVVFIALWLRWRKQKVPSAVL